MAMDPSHGSFPDANLADVRPRDGSEGSRNSTIIRAVKDIAFGSVSSISLAAQGVFIFADRGNDRRSVRISTGFSKSAPAISGLGQCSSLRRPPRLFGANMAR